jgi:hypothetical protein
MSFASRGFTRRRRDAPPGRLPPGQYDVGDGFPVLSAGPMRYASSGSRLWLDLTGARLLTVTFPVPAFRFRRDPAIRLTTPPCARADPQTFAASPDTTGTTTVDDLARMRTGEGCGHGGTRP